MCLYILEAFPIAKYLLTIIIKYTENFMEGMKNELFFFTKKLFLKKVYVIVLLLDSLDSFIPDSR